MLKPIVLSILFTTWIWYTGWASWQLYNYYLLNQITTNQAHASFALGFYEDKNVWNRIRVDNNGQVICSPQKGKEQ